MMILIWNGSIAGSGSMFLTLVISMFLKLVVVVVVVVKKLRNYLWDGSTCIVAVRVMSPCNDISMAWKIICS
jgi:hypothetical protein